MSIYLTVDAAELDDYLARGWTLVRIVSADNIAAPNRYEIAPPRDDAPGGRGSE